MLSPVSVAVAPQLPASGAEDPDGAADPGVPRRTWASLESAEVCSRPSKNSGVFQDKTRACSKKVEFGDSGLVTTSSGIVLGDEFGTLRSIKVHNKEKTICQRSLFVFGLDTMFRQVIVSIVEWRWFDRFILVCIAVNSLMLGIFPYRKDESDWLKQTINGPADTVLWAVFSLESVLKVIAWGFVLDKHSYLRDPWNVLDFIVVCSGLLERFNLKIGVSFLRLFRLLRPLRSLNAAPQMKVLVNTALSSILKLGNVIVLGAFLFSVFGIVGIQLMSSVMYRHCRVAERPELTAGGCWSWPEHEADGGRLCGGNYMCEASGGYCGGHPQDVDPALRPLFPGGLMGPHPWCDGEPRKAVPETDFVHFENFAGAFLLIFQSMTLEGWIDLTYLFEDSFNSLGIFSTTFVVVFFVGIIVMTNFFVLNVALAVVDEVQDQFTDEAKEKKRQTMQKDAEERAERGVAEESTDSEEDDGVWWDCRLVRRCKQIANHDVFGDAIMVIIGANCLTMCFGRFSLDDSFGWRDAEIAFRTMEYIFLGIFIVEMFIMILALGPRGYVKNPITCFDGFVVAGSIVELVNNSLSDGGGGGFLSVLRTFRLFRVMNKLAHKWTRLRVLLKAMYHTGTALKDWLILFGLLLYIFTLMCMHAFATQLRFEDVDSLDPLVPAEDIPPDFYWCPGPYSGTTWNFWQDCIPRAHFDTFPWGVVTVFQVMSGENWNTIMYAGMRASERWSSIWFIPPTVVAALLFILLILFGQGLFMSLFLSMLISKFDEVQDECQKEEEDTLKKFQVSRPNMTVKNLASLVKAKATSVKIIHKDENSSRQQDDRRLMIDHRDKEGRPAANGRASPDSVSSQAFSERRSGEHILFPPNPKILAKDSSSGTTLASSTLEMREVQTVPGQLPYTPDHKDATSRAEAAVRFTGSAAHEAARSSDRALQGELGAADDCGAGRRSSGDHDGEGGDPPEVEGDCSDSGEPVPKGGGRPPGGEKWPAGYACCVFGRANPVRRGCQHLLELKVSVRGDKYKVFDNFILLCIILSSLCMMSVTPLSNPHSGYTRAVKAADVTFVGIFIAEMAVKLVAHGLLTGEHAYLSSGWNWLDGCVVLVSIVDLLPLSGGPGFLRALRILRTFRPLRVVSRFEGLKVVVQTLFRSIGDLFGLMIASFLFLLIFALAFALFLEGKLYQCTPGDTAVGFLGHEFGNLGMDFTTPLCVGGSVINGTTAMGSFNQTTRQFVHDAACPDDRPHRWARASADTPICLARCNPTLESHPPSIEHLCHPKYQNAWELPAVCSGDRTPGVAGVPAQEQVGNAYIADMTRTLVVPCGGYTVSANGQVKELNDAPASASCRSSFCPEAAAPTDACASECQDHKFFCKEACSGDGAGSATCSACRSECEAACMCEDFCTPLILDAALCVEQGGSWEAVLSQNFDNIFNSLLTLFEIATTEGWVDVMYAAADATASYRQPIRDTNMGLHVVLFPLWILLSFFFLLNLVIGVVVDNFADAKKEGKDMMLTDEQKEEAKRWQKWTSGRRMLLKGESIFFGLKNLDKVHPVRLGVYRLISSKTFDNAIMGCIVLNTLVMALTIFPEPLEWWNESQEVINSMFAVIFALEAVLKLFAIRLNYFLDPWNRFDFACVLASGIGVIVGAGSLTSVIRILRIARLFRLLRFLKELNRLFICLFRSIPKLCNVLMMLSLVLVLFSILGMSLFGTAKLHNTFNDHGNFRTFLRGFVTLLRASTGEAWNEIMHDLAKDERDWFRQGSWCTPQQVWNDASDDTAVWDVLEEKCLIAEPNGCGGSWNPLTYMFWIAYTMVTLVMMLNVVVAVILEGYEEGRQSNDEDSLDVCVDVWKKHDPNLTMTIPLKEALLFINEVEARLLERRNEAATKEQDTWRQNVSRMAKADSVGDLVSKVNLRESRRRWCLSLTADDQVTFHSAARMILRLKVVEEEGGNTEEALEKLDDSEAVAPKRDREISDLERLRFGGNGAKDFVQTIAAMKVQRKFRESRRERACKGADASAQPPGLRSVCDPRGQDAEAPR